MAFFFFSSYHCSPASNSEFRKYHTFKTRLLGLGLWLSIGVFAYYAEALGSISSTAKQSHYKNLAGWMNAHSDLRQHLGVHL